MSCAVREFGDALRAARAGQGHPRKRSFAIGILVAMFGSTVLFPPRPLLVWNASSSAPIGLYWVEQFRDIAVGDMVIAHVPKPWRGLAAERRYVPVGVPLVKRVAAASGDSICARGRTVSINGAWAATRRQADAQGRTMPWWEGCILLRDGAVLLLMPDPASFDGRYFGPTKPSDIVGRARLLWAR
jgi:conjugative transfer signal peptidase TraF